MDVRRRYADLGEVTLHYLDTGAGTGNPLVLLHGIP